MFGQVVEFTVGPLDLIVQDAKHRKAYNVIFKACKGRTREKIEKVINEKVAVSPLTAVPGLHAAAVSDPGCRTERKKRSLLQENNDQLLATINDQLRLQSTSLLAAEMENKAKGMAGGFGDDMGARCGSHSCSCFYSQPRALINPFGLYPCRLPNMIVAVSVCAASMTQGT